MKLCRVTHPTLPKPRYAFIEGDAVYLLEEGEWFDRELAPGNYALPLTEVKLLSPVLPSKWFAWGATIESMPPNRK